MVADERTAIVLGVGPERGLGGALCKRFAAEGLHVFCAGRSEEKLAQLKTRIEHAGGRATPFVCDATSESTVSALFDAAAGAGRLDLAVYNAGNNLPGRLRDMSAEYFEHAWRVLCFGGFLFGREMARRLPPQGATLIFTGASASLRGRAGFGAFNSGKAALRTLAQALAKELGAEGLHVAHVIVDGGIAGDRLFSRMDSEPDDETAARFISLQGLVETYWQLYRQTPRAWTFEVDLRTSVENW